MAAKTLFERIWESHLVAEPPGEPALLYVDLHLIHEVTSPQAFEGLRLAGRRVRRPDLSVDRGLVFDTQQLAAQYAMMGDGLALVDPILFAEDIKAGRLVRPFDIWLDEGYGYYLTTHPEDLSNEAVALFRSWAIARFAADRQQLEVAVGQRPAASAK